LPSTTAYDQLIDLRDGHNARYRLIDHPPAGRTEVVSPLRGNNLSSAAKCIITILKLGRKTTKYVLAVILGDRKLDLNTLKLIFGATYVSFASADIAERLAGSPSGTILPFSFSPDLELIADPRLRRVEDLFFNAARLDRSVALNAEDYFQIARPRVERIAE